MSAEILENAGNFDREIGGRFFQNVSKDYIRMIESLQFEVPEYLRSTISCKKMAVSLETAVGCLMVRDLAVSLIEHQAI